MVRFIRMLGEFLLSYRFPIDTPYQNGFADGWSKPHPYSGVPNKQQLIGLPGKAG